jgi:hypothetical protein
MYYDTDSYLEMQMHRFKKEAATALSSIVHPKFVQEFSAIIAFGYQEEMPEARKIADIFNLDQRHFFAVLDREEDFQEEIVKYNEKAI